MSLAVFLVVLGVIIAGAAIIALTNGLWTYATSHKQQPKQAVLVNLLLLTILPAAATVYIAYDELVLWKYNDRGNATYFEIGMPLLWSVVCIHLFILLPVCRGSWLEVGNNIGAFATVVLALVAGLNTLQQGLWDSGGDFSMMMPYLQYSYSTQVFGWESINYTHSIITIKLPKDTCPPIDLITNCTWFDHADFTSTEDDDYVWSTLKVQPGLVFNCTNGINKNDYYDDDEVTVDDDNYFGTRDDDHTTVERTNAKSRAQNMLVNNHACTAAWMSTALARRAQLDLSADFYEASEERYGRGAIAFGILSALVGALTMLTNYFQRRGDQKELHQPSEADPIGPEAAKDMPHRSQWIGYARRAHLGWGRKEQETHDIAKSSSYQQPSDITPSRRRDVYPPAQGDTAPHAKQPIGFAVNQFISLPKDMAPLPKQPIGYAVDQFISLPKDMVPPPKQPIGVAIDRFISPPTNSGAAPLPKIRILVCDR
jgi:hypothetical protein